MKSQPEKRGSSQRRKCKRLFPDHPELLRATQEIADRCNLELELGKTIFPEFPVPEENRGFRICGS